jgi:Rieske Fe-S protein
VLVNANGTRRTVLGAMLAGSILLLTPLTTAVWVLLEPLRRKSATGGMIRVTGLDALPADGKPHTFPVIQGIHDDAWTRVQNVPVGSVHLIRHPDREEILALNSTCPHAGCLVPYSPQKECFACPCHTSSFDLTGARVNPEKSPSPRDMDSLVCEVRDGGVWVEYQNFQIATSEKKPRV